MLTAPALPQTGATGCPGRRICPTSTYFQAAKTQPHVLWEVSGTQNRLVSHLFTSEMSNLVCNSPEGALQLVN